MNSVINSWKNSNVFQSQLSLNLKELSSENMYPPHWLSFLGIVNTFQPKTMLDVGCGCGVYYELCKKHFDIEYTGIDYAKEAIEHFSLENQILLFQKIKKAMKKPAGFVAILRLIPIGTIANCILLMNTNGKTKMKLGMC